MWKKKKYLNLMDDKKVKSILKKNKELRKKLKRKIKPSVARTLP